MLSNIFRHTKQIKEHDVVVQQWGLIDLPHDMSSADSPVSHLSSTKQYSIC